MSGIIIKICFCVLNFIFQPLYCLNTCSQNHLSFRLSYSVLECSQLFFSALCYPYCCLNSLQYLHPSPISSRGQNWIRFTTYHFVRISPQMQYQTQIFCFYSSQLNYQNYCLQFYFCYLVIFIVVNLNPYQQLRHPNGKMSISYSSSHNLSRSILNNISSFLFLCQAVDTFVMQIIPQVRIFSC